VHSRFLRDGPHDLRFRTITLVEECAPKHDHCRWRSSSHIEARPDNPRHTLVFLGLSLPVWTNWDPRVVYGFAASIACLVRQSRRRRLQWRNREFPRAYGQGRNHLHQARGFDSGGLCRVFDGRDDRSEIAQMEPQLVTRDPFQTGTGPAGGVGQQNSAKVARFTYLDLVRGWPLPPSPKSSCSFFFTRTASGSALANEFLARLMSAPRHRTSENLIRALSVRIWALRSWGSNTAPSRPFKGPSARSLFANGDSDRRFQAVTPTFGAPSPEKRAHHLMRLFRTRGCVPIPAELLAQGARFLARPAKTETTDSQLKALVFKRYGGADHSVR